MRENDLRRVLEINEACVPEVGPLDTARLEFLVGESEVALVATSHRSDDPGDPGTIADHVLGFCLVLGPGSSYDSVNYRWFMERHDDAWYLDRVALAGSARRLGVGTALYAAVDREIEARRSAGARIGRLGLEVNVEPPNDASLAFHAARNFVEVGRQATPYGTEVALLEKRY
jgi:hypothetical protein